MFPFSFQSKVYTRTPTLYLDFKLDQGAKHSQPIPKGMTGLEFRSHVRKKKIKSKPKQLLSC